MLILIFCFSMQVYSQENSEKPDWFILSELVSQSWELLYSPLDPLRFRLARPDWEDATSVKKIMLVFPKASSAYDVAVERITTLFESKDYPVELTAINFRGDPQLGRSVIREIESGVYDLVFSVGSNSTSYLTDNLVNSSVPVVSVTSKDPVLLGQVDDYDSGSGTNFAFTSLNIPVSVQLAYLYELRPDLKNVGIFYAKNNLSAYKTQALPLMEALIEQGVNVTEVIVEDQENAAEELTQKIPPIVDRIRENDPIYQHSIFWITGSTSVFNEIEIINRYSESVPIISVVTDVVKPGPHSAAISIGVGFRSNADIAAFYAYDILTEDADPGTLPVGIVSPPDIAINFNVARRIGLKIPFNFLEAASTIYGVDGELKRRDGENLVAR